MWPPSPCRHFSTAAANPSSTFSDTGVNTRILMLCWPDCISRIQRFMFHGYAESTSRGLASEPKSALTLVLDPWSYAIAVFGPAPVLQRVAQPTLMTQVRGGRAGGRGWHAARVGGGGGRRAAAGAPGGGAEGGKRPRLAGAGYRGFVSCPDGTEEGQMVIPRFGVWSQEILLFQTHRSVVPTCMTPTRGFPQDQDHNQDQDQ